MMDRRDLFCHCQRLLLFSRTGNGRMKYDALTGRVVNATSRTVHLSTRADGPLGIISSFQLLRQLIVIMSL